MKTCRNCGALIDDNVKFCSSCGAQQPDNNTSGGASDYRNSNTFDGSPNRAENNYQYGYSTDPVHNTEPAGTDPFAITALVLGIAGIIFSWTLFGVPSILGLIFGIVAMNRCKKEGRAGYGMALAGMIVSIIILVIYFIIIALAMATISSAFGAIGNISYYF